MTGVEAAAKLGVPYRRLRQWLKDGAMSGAHVGKDWDVSEEEVERVRLARVAAIAPIQSELEVAERVTAIVGTLRGKALRQVVEHATEIVRLAQDWETRAEGGAAGSMNLEVADTIARHVRDLAVLESALRGLSAVYRSVRDDVIGLAKITEVDA